MGTMAESPLREYTNENDLPAELRELLNGSRSLPLGIQFFPAGRARVEGVFGYLFAAVLAGLVGGVLIWLDLSTLHGRSFTHRLSYQMYLLKGGGACLVVALGLLWKGLHDLRRTQEQASGNGPRHGLFLTPDTLFIRSGMDIKTISRASVTGLAVDEGSGRLLFNDDAGSPSQASNIDEEVDPALRAQAQAAIRDWIRDR
jgi:hypothetical protein